MLIKALLVAGLVLGALYTIRGRRTALHTLVRRSLTVAFFVGGFVAVLFPSLLTDLANALGVGRGADLLLYVLTIACVFTTIAFHRRFRELEDRFVELSRAVALDRVDRTDPVALDD